jgi:hypothetical protein
MLLQLPHSWKVETLKNNLLWKAIISEGMKQNTQSSEILQRIKEERPHYILTRIHTEISKSHFESVRIVLNVKSTIKLIMIKMIHYFSSRIPTFL